MDELESKENKESRENDIQQLKKKRVWNDVFLRFSEGKIRQFLNTAHKKCVRAVVLDHEKIEEAIKIRSMLKSSFEIYCYLGSKDQRNPGMPKFQSRRSDFFESDGFILEPIRSQNLPMILKDIKDCSVFFSNFVERNVSISWDIGSLIASDADKMKVVSDILKYCRPNYLWFAKNQDILCAFSKSKNAISTVSPKFEERSSDFSVINFEDL